MISYIKFKVRRKRNKILINFMILGGNILFIDNGANNYCDSQMVALKYERLYKTISKMQKKFSKTNTPSAL